MNLNDHNPERPTSPTRGAVIDESRPGVGTLTTNPPDQEPAKRSSEKVARGIIEKQRGGALSDKEWARHRERLLKFGLTLQRWEKAAQRDEIEGKERTP